MINLIIIHCSDSNNPKHDDISVIDKWHKQRKFKKVGYHFFIKSNGQIQFGRNLDETGAHCKGKNKNSIGICFHGKDLEKEITQEQIDSARVLLKDLLHRYNLGKENIFPHNYFNAQKSCPNFNIEVLLNEMVN